MDRKFLGRTDSYTLNLYRGKGYVLDKRFLDLMIWKSLVNHVHGESKILTKPCSIVINAPEPPDMMAIAEAKGLN